MTFCTSEIASFLASRSALRGFVLGRSGWLCPGEKAARF